MVLDVMVFTNLTTHIGLYMKKYIVHVATLEITNTVLRQYWYS